jgi:NTP pyrophosphatase (non-canonical NTP hydrolase)
MIKNKAELELLSLEELFNYYQNSFIFQTCIQPSWNALFCGLIEENGEIAGIFKRIYRGDENYHQNDENTRAKIIKEFGDFLWYLIAVNKYFGDHNLDVILYKNSKDYIQEYPAMLGDMQSARELYKPLILSQKAQYLLFKIDATFNYYKIDFKEVLLKNIEKLTNRKQNNTLKGEGER